MSGQRSRKVRMGSSRRKISDQKEKSDPDDGTLKTVSLSTAEHSVAEESSESVADLVAEPHYPQSESQTVAEVTRSRRKLGSSRKINDRKDVKDNSVGKSHISQYSEMREEVDDNTPSKEELFHKSSNSASYQEHDSVQRPDIHNKQLNRLENLREETGPENEDNEQSSTLSSNKAVDTVTLPPEQQPAVTIADTRQDEMSQASGHDSSVSSTNAPEDSFEFGTPATTSRTDAVPECLIPKSEDALDVDVNHDDNKPKGVDPSLVQFQSEEVRDHVETYSSANVVAQLHQPDDANYMHDQVTTTQIKEIEQYKLAQLVKSDDGNETAISVTLDLSQNASINTSEHVSDSEHSWAPESDASGAHGGQQGIMDQRDMNHGENTQTKSTGKRRKMGSTRRPQPKKAISDQGATMEFDTTNVNVKNQESFEGELNMICEPIHNTSDTTGNMDLTLIENHSQSHDINKSHNDTMETPVEVEPLDNTNDIEKSLLRGLRDSEGTKDDKSKTDPLNMNLLGEQHEDGTETTHEDSFASQYHTIIESDSQSFASQYHTIIESDSQSHDINTSHNEPMDTPEEMEPLDNTNDVEKSSIYIDASDQFNINLQDNTESINVLTSAVGGAFPSEDIGHNALLDQYSTVLTSTPKNVSEQPEEENPQIKSTGKRRKMGSTRRPQPKKEISDQGANMEFDTTDVNIRNEKSFGGDLNVISEPIHNTSNNTDNMDLTLIGSDNQSHDINTSHNEPMDTPVEVEPLDNTNDDVEKLSIDTVRDSEETKDEKSKTDYINMDSTLRNILGEQDEDVTETTLGVKGEVEERLEVIEEANALKSEKTPMTLSSKSHEEDYDEDSPDTAEHVSKQSLESKSDASDVHKGTEGILDQQYKKQNDENQQIKSTGKRRKMGSTRKHQPKKAINDQGATMEFDTTDVNMRNKESFEAELNATSEPIHNTRINTDNMGVTLIGSDSQSHDINTSHDEPMDTPVEVEPLDNTNDDVEKSSIDTVRDSEETKDDKSETDDINMDSTPRNVLGEQDEDGTETTLKESFASEYHQDIDAAEQFDIQDNTESMNTLSAAVGDASHSDDDGNNALLDQDSTVVESTATNVREQPVEENTEDTVRDSEETKDDKSDTDHLNMDSTLRNLLGEQDEDVTESTLGVKAEVEKTLEVIEEVNALQSEQTTMTLSSKSHEEDYDEDSRDTAEHVTEQSWESKSDASDAHRGHEGILDQQDEKQNDENPQIKSTGKRRKMGSTRKRQPKKAINDQGATMEFDTTDVNIRNQESFEAELNATSEPIHNTSNNTDNMGVTLVGSDSQSHDINTSHNAPMDTPVEVEPLDNTNDDVEMSSIDTVRDSEETKDDKSETDDINMHSTTTNVLGEQDEDGTETTLKESFASEYHQDIDAAEQFDIQDNTETMNTLTAAMGDASHSEDDGNNALLDQDSTVVESTATNVIEITVEENTEDTVRDSEETKDDKSETDNLNMDSTLRNLLGEQDEDVTESTLGVKGEVEKTLEVIEEVNALQSEQTTMTLSSKSHEEDYDEDSRDTAEHVSEQSWESKSDASDAHRGHEGILDQQDEKQNDENPQIKSTGKMRKMGSTRKHQPKKAINDQGATMEFETTDVNIRNQESFEAELNATSEPIHNTRINTDNMGVTLIGSDSQSHDINTSHDEPMDTPVEVEPLDNTNDDVEKSSIDTVRDSEETKDDKSETDDINMDSTPRNVLGEQDEDGTETTLKESFASEYHQDIDAAEQFDIQDNTESMNTLTAAVGDASHSDDDGNNALLDQDSTVVESTATNVREQPVEENTEDTVRDSEETKDDKSDTDHLNMDSTLRNLLGEQDEDVTESTLGVKGEVEKTLEVIEEVNALQSEKTTMTLSSKSHEEDYDEDSRDTAEHVTEQSWESKSDASDAHRGHEGILDQQDEKQNDENPQIKSTGKRRKMGSTRKHQPKKAINDQGATMEFDTTDVNMRNKESFEAELNATSEPIHNTRINTDNMGVTLIGSDSQSHDINTSHDEPMDTPVEVEPLDNTNDDVEKSSIDTVRDSEETKDDKSETDDINMDSTPRNVLGEQDEDGTETTLKESFASEYHQDIDAAEQFDIQDNTESMNTLSAAVGDASHSDDDGNNALLDQDSTVVESTATNVREQPVEENTEDTVRDSEETKDDKSDTDHLNMDSTLRNLLGEQDEDVTESTLGVKAEVEKTLEVIEEVNALQSEQTTMTLSSKSHEEDYDEDSRDTAEHVTEQSWESKSDASDAHRGHEGILDQQDEKQNDENPQIKSTGKRRKMGSTRKRQPKKAINDQGATMEFDTTDVNIRNQESFEAELNATSEPIHNTSNNTDNMGVTLVGSDSQSHDINTSHNAPMDTPVEVEPLDNTNDDVEMSSIDTVRDSEETKDDKSETDDINMHSTTTNVLGEQDEDGTETTLKESFASEYHQDIDAAEQFDIQDNTETMNTLTAAMGDASHSEDDGNNALLDQDSTVVESTATNVIEITVEENTEDTVRDSEETKDDKSETDNLNMDSTLRNLLGEQDEDVTESTLGVKGEVEKTLEVIEEVNALQSEQTTMTLSSKSHEEDYDEDSRDTAEHVSEQSWESKSDASDAHRGHEGILDQQDEKQNDENPQIKSTGKMRKMGSTRKHQPKKAINDQGATMEFETTDVNIRNQESFEAELNATSEPIHNTRINTDNMGVTLIGSDSQSHDINTSHDEPMDTPVEVEPLDNTNDDVEKSSIDTVRDSEETKDDKSETDDINMDSTPRNVLGEQDEDGTETTLKESFASEYHQDIDAAEQFDIQDNTESMNTLTAAVGDASHSDDDGNNALLDQDSTVVESTATNVREQPVEENTEDTVRDSEETKDDKSDTDHLNMDSTLRNLLGEQDEDVTESTLGVKGEVEKTLEVIEEVNALQSEKTTMTLSSKSHEEDYDEDSRDTAEHVTEQSWESKSDASDAHRGHEGILDQQDEKQNDENPQIKSTGKRRKMGSTRKHQPKKAINDQGATMEFETTDVNIRNQESFEAELNATSEPIHNTRINTDNMGVTLIGSDSQSHDINTSHDEPMDTPVEVEPLDNTNDDVEKSSIDTVRDSEETKDDKSETDDRNMDSTPRNVLGEQDEDGTETTLKESFASEYHQDIDAAEQFDIQDNTESMNTLTAAVGDASHSDDDGTNALLDQDSTVVESTATNVREQPVEENTEDTVRDSEETKDDKSDTDHLNMDSTLRNLLGEQDEDVTESTLGVKGEVEKTLEVIEEVNALQSEQTTMTLSSKSHEEDYDEDSSDTAEHVTEQSWESKSDASDAHRGHEGILDQQDEKQNDENPQIKSTGKRRKMGSTRKRQPKKAINDQGATMEFDTTDVNIRNQESFEAELNATSEPIHNTSNNTDNMGVTLVGSDSQSHDINTSHNAPMDTPVEVEPLDNTNDDVEMSSIDTVRDSEETKDDKSETDDINMDSTTTNVLGEQDEDGTETTLKESFASEYHQDIDAAEQFDIQDNTETMNTLTAVVGDASHSEDDGNNALLDQDSTVVESTATNVIEITVEENTEDTVRDSEETKDDKSETDNLNMDSTLRNLLGEQAEDVTESTLGVKGEVEKTLEVIEEVNALQSEQTTMTLSSKSHEEDYDEDSRDTAEHVSEQSWESKSHASDAHRGHEGILDQQDEKQNDENPQIKSTGKRRKMGSTRKHQPKKAINDQGATMEFETTDVNIRNQESFEAELNATSEPIHNTCINTDNMGVTLIGSDSQSHDINTSHDEPMDMPVEVEPLDNTNDDVEKSSIDTVRDSEETKDDKSETDDINMDSTPRNVLGEQDEDGTETTLKESFASEYHQDIDAAEQFDIQDNTESMNTLTAVVGDGSHSDDDGNNALLDQDSTVVESTATNVREQPVEENTEDTVRDSEETKDDKSDTDHLNMDSTLRNLLGEQDEDVTESTLGVKGEVEKTLEVIEEVNALQSEQTTMTLSSKSHEEDYDEDSSDTAEHVTEQSWESKSDASDAHRGHEGILDQQDEKQNDENPQIKSTGKRRKMGSTRKRQPKKAINDQGATMEFDTTDVNIRNQESFEAELNATSEPIHNTSNNTDNMGVTLVGSDSQSHDINTSHNAPMDTPVEVEPLDNTNDDVEMSSIDTVRDSEETKDDKSETDDINMDSTTTNVLGEQDEDGTETTLKESFASEYHQDIDAAEQFDIQDNTETMNTLTAVVGDASHSEDDGNNALLDQDSTVVESTATNVIEITVEENTEDTVRDSEETKDDKSETDNLNMDSTLRNLLGEQAEDVTESTLGVKGEVEKTLEVIEEVNALQSEQTTMTLSSKSHEEDYDEDSRDTAEHVSEQSWESKSHASDAHRGHEGILDQQDEKQNDENPQIKSTGKRRKMGSTRKHQPKKAINDQGATMEFETTDVNIRNQESFEAELNATSEPIHNTCINTDNMGVTLIGSDSQSHDINTSHDEPMDMPVEVEPLDNTNDDVEKSSIDTVRDSEETKDDKSETDDINMDSTPRNVLGEQDEDGTETTLKESFASEYHQDIDAAEQFDIQDNTESMNTLTAVVGDASHSDDDGNNALLDQDSTVVESTATNVREQPVEENTEDTVRDSEETKDDKSDTDHLNMDSTLRNLLGEQDEDVTESTLGVKGEVEKTLEVIEEVNALQSEQTTMTLSSKSHEEDYDEDSRDTAEHVSEQSWESKSDASDEGIMDQQDKKQNDENPQMKSTGKRRKMGSTRKRQPKKAINDQGATMEFDTTDVNRRNQESFEAELNATSEPIHNTSNNTDNMGVNLIGSDSQSHDINTSHDEPMDTPVEVEPLDNTNDDVEMLSIDTVRDSEETKDDKSETDDINMDSTPRNVLGEQDEDGTETTLKESFASEYHQDIDATEQFDIRDNTETMNTITVVVGDASHSDDDGNNALLDQDPTVVEFTATNVREQPVEENTEDTVRDSQETKDDKSETDNLNMDSTLRNLLGEQDEDVTEGTLRVKGEVEERIEVIEEANALQSEKTPMTLSSKSHEEDYDEDSPDTAEHVSEQSWESKSDTSDAHRGHEGIMDQQDKKQNEENPQIKSTGKRRKMGSTRKRQPKKAINDQGATMEFETTDVNIRNQESFEGELNATSEPIHNTSNNTDNMDLILIESDSQSHDINTSHNEPMDTPVEVEPLDNTNDDVEMSSINTVRDSDETKDINMDSTPRNFVGEQDEDGTETTLKESFASEYHQDIDAADKFDIQDNTESMNTLTAAVGDAYHSQDVGNNALLDQDLTVVESTSTNVRERPVEENTEDTVRDCEETKDDESDTDHLNMDSTLKNLLGEQDEDVTEATVGVKGEVEERLEVIEEVNALQSEKTPMTLSSKSHEEDYDKDTYETAEHVSRHGLASKSDASDAHRGHQEILDEHDKKLNDENPQIKSTGKRRKMGSTRKHQPKKAVNDESATMEIDTTDVDVSNQKSFERELNVTSESIHNTSNNTDNMGVTLIATDSQSHDITTSHNEPLDKPVEVEPLDNTNDDVEKSSIDTVRDSEETKNDKSETDHINMDSTPRNVLGEQDEDGTETTLKESYSRQYHRQEVDDSDKFDIHLQDNTVSINVLTGVVGAASHNEDVGNNALLDQDSTAMTSTHKNVRERPEDENLGRGRDEKLKIDLEISELNDENPQIKSTGKRRKMGSTRIRLQPKEAIIDQGATMEFDTTDVNMGNRKSFEGELNVIIVPAHNTSNNTGNMDLTLIGSDSQSHDINTSHNEPMNTPVEVEPLDNTNDDVEKSSIDTVRDSEETKDDKTETDNINLDSTLSNLLGEQDEDVTETTVRVKREVEEGLEDIDEANALQSVKTPMTLCRPNSEIKESFASQYHRQDIDASDQFDVHLQDNTESMDVLTGTEGSASQSEDAGKNALLDQDSTVAASTSTHVRPEEENLGHVRDETQTIDVDISEVAKNARDAIMVETTSPTECEAVMDRSHLSDTKSHEEDYDKYSPDTAEHVSEQSLESKSDAADARRGQEGILDQHDKNQNDENPQTKSTGKRRKMGSTRKHQAKKAVNDQGAIMEFDTTDFGTRIQKSFEGDLNVTSEPIHNTSNNTDNMDLTLIGSDNQSHDINTPHNEPMDTLVEVEPLDNTNDDVEKSLIDTVRDSEETKDDKSETDHLNMDSTIRNLLGEQDEDGTETTLKESFASQYHRQDVNDSDQFDIHLQVNAESMNVLTGTVGASSHSEDVGNNALLDQDSTVMTSTPKDDRVQPEEESFGHGRDEKLKIDVDISELNYENPQIKSTGKRRKMGSTRIKLQPKEAISDQGATMEFDTTDVNMRNKKSFEGELNVIIESVHNTSNNTGNMDLTLIGRDSQSHDINTSHNEPVDTPVEVEPLDNTNDDVEKSLINTERDSEEAKDDKSETDDINMDSTLRNLLGEQDEDVTETTLRLKREVEEKLEVIEEAADTTEHLSEHSWASKSDEADAHRGHEGILGQDDKNQNDENPHIKSTGKRRKMGSTRKHQPQKAISDQGATMEFDTTDVNMGNQKSFEGELNVISEPIHNTSNNTDNMEVTLISDNQSHDINTSHNEPMDTPVEVEPLDNTNDDVEKSAINTVRDSEETQDEEVTETTLRVKREAMERLEVIDEANASNDEIKESNTEDSSDTHRRRKMGSSRKITRFSPKEEKPLDDVIAVQEQEVTRAELSVQKEISRASQGSDENALVDPEKLKQLQPDVEGKYDNSEEQRQTPREAAMDSSHLSDTKSHEEDYDKDSTDTAEHVSEQSWVSKSDPSDAHEGILDQHVKNQNDEDPQIKSTGKRRKMGSSRKIQPKKEISDHSATMEFDTTDVDVTNQSHDINTSHNEPKDTVVEGEPLDNTNDDVEKSSINTARNSEETKDDKPKTDSRNVGSTLGNLLGEQDEDVTETTLKVKRDVLERLEVIDEANASKDEIKESNTEDMIDTHRRRKMGSSRNRKTTRFAQKEKSLEDVIEVQEQEVTRADLSVQAISRASQGSDENARFSPEQQKQLQVDAEHKYDEIDNPVSGGELIARDHHLSPIHMPSNSTSSPLNTPSFEKRRRKMGSNRKSRGQQQHGGPTNGDEVLSSGDETVERSSSNSNRLHSSQEASGRVSDIQHQSPGGLQVHDKEQGRYMGNSKECGKYNVVIVGNSYVGKTSYVKRVKDDKFSPDFGATIGIDTCKHSVTVNGKTAVLELWDTAGQERFRSITRQTFHRAQAFLLVYDVTSSQSFRDVSYWINCIQEGATEDVTIMLLGNKIDCAKREVHSHEGKALAQEYNIEFVECSAATGENVTQSMETIARMLIQKHAYKEEGLVLRNEPQQKKSSGCC